MKTFKLIINLKEILSKDKEDFLESIQFNYMLDLQWLIQQYPAENRQKPMTLVHDPNGEKELKMLIRVYNNVNLIKVYDLNL